MTSLPPTNGASTHDRHAVTTLGLGVTAFGQRATSAAADRFTRPGVALDIRTVCPIPIVLDAGAGFGDPVHMHRTVAMSEAAGIQCIEIEDQLLPRRVEHHVGIDNLVTPQIAADRIREAVAARTNPDTVIVGRTNAIRVGGMDDALRRAEAMKKAGAIVTDHGGITSHAAIVSRELNIPCLIGTRYATKLFKDGDKVIVCPRHGYIKFQ